MNGPFFQSYLFGPVSLILKLDKICDSIIGDFVASIQDCSILPLFAYVWQSGPWHMLWCKYLLDPRSDSKYRHYQVIELRNKLFGRRLEQAKMAPPTDKL